MRKICALNSRHILNYLKLFICVVITFSLGTGCSITRTKKESPSLASVTTNQVYQVRVRTGNLALDKITYEYARDSFRKYLVIPRKGPYNAYIDITFESTTHAPLKWPSIVNWSEPLKWSEPGYENNVAYGDVWYTGKDKIGRKGIGRTETEIKPSGLLTWHNGIMSVTLKDKKGRTFWSAEYTYKGGWNPSEILYIYSSDGAVKLSLNAVLKKFERVYILEPVKKRAAMELAARLAVEEEDAAQRAGIDFNRNAIVETKPVVALVKKSNLPKKPEEPVRMDEKRWKFTGKNRAGIPVHIDKTTIHYPEKYIVQIWAATIRNNHKKTNLYEIECLTNKFRIIDKVPDKSSSTPKWSGQRTTIFPYSTPEIIYKAVCPKNIRLQHTTKTITAPTLSLAAGIVKRDKEKTKSSEPGNVTPEIQKTEAIAKNTKNAETEDDAAELKSAAGEKLIRESQVTTEAGIPAKAEQTVQELKAAPEEKESHESGVAVKVVYSPQAQEVTHMDEKRWKLLGRNQKEFPVYIDKKTISYPAAYVVRLWSKIINDNHNHLELYEIGCLKNNFRIVNEDSDKPAFLPSISNRWQIIFPESTPEVIYNAVCPKKIRPRQKVAHK